MTSNLARKSRSSDWARWLSKNEPPSRFLMSIFGKCVSAREREIWFFRLTPTCVQKSPWHLTTRQMLTILMEMTETCNFPQKKPRQIVYVCVGFDISANDCISRTISAATPQQAAEQFLQDTGVSAKDIHGPFKHKRTQVLRTTQTLRFADQAARPAIYREWQVNSFLLTEPENHAYLIFLHRTDGKKQTTPQGTIIVPITELRLLP